MSKNRIIKVVLIGVLIIVLVVSSRSQIGDDGQSGYNEDDDGDGDGDGSNFDLQNLEPGLQGPQ